MRLVWSWAPYASVLLAAVVFFGLGFMKSSDRWAPFAHFMDAAAGPNGWAAQGHRYQHDTKSLIVDNLTLTSGAIFGLSGKVTVTRLELVAPRFEENHARADLLMAQGLTNELPGGPFGGTLAISYFELERLDLTGPPTNPAISADRGLAKNLTAAWSRAVSPPHGAPPDAPAARKLSLALDGASFEGGIVVAPSGRLSVNQGNITRLSLTFDPGDDPSELTVSSILVRSLDEKARSQSLELSGLGYRFPLGAQRGPWPPQTLSLGRLRVQSLDLGPMVKGLTHLSLTEMADMFLSAPASGRSWQRLSADLALARPFGAIRAELSDLALATLGGETVSAKSVTVSPLSRFNLRAQVTGLALDLAPPPDGTARSRAPFISHLGEAGLLPLTADLELSSAYDPAEQTYDLELTSLNFPDLASGRAKLTLTDIDRGSLSSLSRLTFDNPLAPLLESGLHHSKLTNLSVSLENGRLTERLIEAASPKSADPVAMAAKSQRLSDLFEMALTMRLDNVVENTREISEMVRAFLIDPETIGLSIIPEPPLSPGEVRFSRDFPTLMNSVNIALSVNGRPPLKVLFRTDPAAFDRDYTQDETGLYPGEMRP